MLYTNKPFLKGLFIFALFLLPVIKAAADDLPRQFNQLQSRMTEANERIAMLASDQQRSIRTINALQSRLNTTHQEISNLKNNEILKHNRLDATNAEIHRTANGHGR